MVIDSVFSNGASSLLIDIAFIIIVATAFAIVFKVLRQPSIVAYIITGIILGPLVLGIISIGSVIKVFSEIGIAFLLFLVGLSLNFNVLKKVGKISLITGLGQ